MLRPNAEGEAVQAAPSAWGICLKQIISPAVFSDRTHRCRNSIDKTAGRVETAEVKLDCNILWRDQTKLDTCTHPNFGSNRQGGVGSLFDGLDSNVLPFLPEASNSWIKDFICSFDLRFGRAAAQPLFAHPVAGEGSVE